MSEIRYAPFGPLGLDYFPNLKKTQQATGFPYNPHAFAAYPIISLTGGSRGYVLFVPDGGKRPPARLATYFLPYPLRWIGNDNSYSCS